MVTLNPAFEEKAAEAIEALVVHSQYGLAARCSAVNSATTDDGYLLPVAWVSIYEQESEDHLQYPFHEVYTAGSDQQEPIIVGTNEYRVQGRVRCWMDPSKTHNSPIRQAKMYRRLSWALWRLFTERTPSAGGRWNARTLLGQVANLEDIAIVPTKRLGKGMAVVGIGAEVSFTVMVEEEDTE